MGVNEFGNIAISKYERPRNSHFKLPDRTWPDKDIEQAPIWCAVDLRDGNQALPNPMKVEEKLEYFQILLEMGFKEIEIGFPSASQEEFGFTRKIIEDKLIPDDVKIQVLVPCVEKHISRTRESLEGAKNVIVHLYNSTSTQQREIVFRNTRQETIDLALNGVDWIKRDFQNFRGNFHFQYSPESFAATELDFSAKICNEVNQRFGDFGGKPITFNLPATVENSTPNIHADKIESMIREVKDTACNEAGVIISLHAHNDRGTGVAATELALQAGADRVEGTLFGEGERTGNVDLVTLAGNMFSQGIDPRLDLSNIGDVAERVVAITQIPIHPRHPYVGDLVFTAFSGSHQDAINKGFEQRGQQGKWEIPYLPIDPTDLGQEYQPIQINSQSGKGGIAFILKKHGYDIPKAMQPYAGSIIQTLTEKEKRKLAPEEIVEEFQNHFVNVDGEISMEGFHYEQDQGNKGILVQFADFITERHGIAFNVVNYGEQAMSEGRGALAATHVEITYNGETYFGIGEDSDLAKSPLKALVSALNIAKKNQ